MPRGPKRAPAKSVQRVGKRDGANAANAKPKAQTAIRDRVVGLRRVPARDLLANPKNWRRHPESQRSALGGMLSEVGIADALIARETPDGLMLIDGHLRQDVLGDQEVPVLVLDVTEEEADKLLLTLDPLAAMAEMDGAMVRDLLDGVAWQSQDGVQALLDDLSRQSERLLVREGLTEPDDAPPLSPNVVSAPGDVWLCGEHRVMCGDATSAEDVGQLLASEKPLLCVTDPPYGVNYDPAWRNVEAAKGRLAYAASRVGQVANDDRSDWSKAWEITPSDVIYSWHPAGAPSLVHAKALQNSGFVIRMQIIWAKPNFPIGRGDYHVRHEPCWYAVRKGRPSHRTDDRTQTTLWEINLDKNVEGGHSTQKPIECMERPIRNHSGDVYDSFLGSGTTLIAAERMGRKCYGMEIAEHYVDVSVRRWQNYTGKEATLEATGETFAQREAACHASA